MKILAIDVGMGTQDILLYDSKKNMENCFKMVLPSQTQIIAGRISKETQLKNDIVLLGETMGGGPCASAVRRHIGANLTVYATEKAALTLNDSIGKVKEMGVTIVSEDKANDLKATNIRMCDIDRPALEKALSLFDIPMPDKFAVAVQDHGYSPDISNRKFRFDYFMEKMINGASLDSFVYKDDIPQRLTRMKAVQSSLPGALLIDTGIAAIRGALLDSNAKLPCLAVNIGNGHTLAGIIDDGEIIALMEHHTHQMTSGKLDDLLERLSNGKLGFDEIYDDGGHGCYIRKSPGIDHLGSILVTGPRRDIMRESALDLHFAAPYGDMMLTGCFGLIDGYLHYIHARNSTTSL
jgi:uncharacterized protein (DUF1786 family)